MLSNLVVTKVYNKSNILLIILKREVKIRMNLKEQKEEYLNRVKEIDSLLSMKDKDFEGESKFYTFNQNNSGGHFEQNENVDIYVIIEAKSAEHANLLADDIGIYFDGCNSGVDCNCCGDRWYRASENDGEVEPMIYGERAEEYKTDCIIRDTMRCIIYYLDGKKSYIDI